MPIGLLKVAYSNGFFPMPNPQTGEIEWLRPEPRAILPLDGFHVSHSLQKLLNKATLRHSTDKAFEEVMHGCADRKEGTWITDIFLKSYLNLFKEGLAHSVEVWHGRQLVGGVYGVTLGAAFFAESMFHRETNASKVALHHLVKHLRTHHFELLEVQFLTPHLERLGAIEIPDERYQDLLASALGKMVEW